ncbi:MAG: NADH pyrophosphatase zinc ribbon domain-containing protein [Nodosilinea sp.]
MKILYPQDDTLHPLQLECPRCGHRTVVTRAEHHYVCLNCNWERNVSRGGLPTLGNFLLFIITLFLVVVIFG